MPSPAIIFSGRTPVIAARQNMQSLAAESLHGKPALTPIIAGSICGGLLVISWTIGFIVYFRKRINRKKRKRLLEQGVGTLREKDVKLLQTTVIIPPDPAVLLGHRKAGEMVFPERENSTACKLPWSRQNSQPIPSSASKGSSTTSASEKVGETPHADHADTPMKHDAIDDTSHETTTHRPKVDIHSNDSLVTSDNNDSPSDDQVTDMTRILRKV